MTQNERTKVFERVDSIVRRRFFDPKFNGRDWPALVQRHRDSILSTGNDKDFESEVNRLLAELGTSHTNFFHKTTPVPSRNSINATFKAWETADGSRWVFQDVQPGGPADRAGAKPGDILLKINDLDFRPPERPTFRMDSAAALTLIHRNGVATELRLGLKTPQPKYSDCPYAEPQSVIDKKLEGGIGYLKVSMFPGIIGVDFARDLDHALARLSQFDRLIIDLRGNPGGGIGALRLMSYLTPDRIPVGYSLTRGRAERGYRREDLPQFRGIPTRKWELPLLAARFAGRDMSIAVVTEGKGPQKFHNRIVILVNEHTAGSGEMVAGFARENHLAKIVGKKTAGRLLGGKGCKIGGEYILMLPIGAYVSWGGQRFEGVGLEPDVAVDWTPANASDGNDLQLTTALEQFR
jgi:C-terminal processing protease CtpA/Prc